MGTNQPLIFIPGLFGSMGDEIIPGTGDFSFGPAGMVYNEFIYKLESIGYKRDENLFICFYNWKKECAYNAQKYLSETIRNVKRATGSQKVDIIAHSLGGLVSRSYICSKQYGNDVNKLILIGCPNAGATDAYYAWAEGKVPERNGSRPFLHHIILEGFLTVYFHNNSSMKEQIHEEFKSIHELLPSYGFGKYLYYLDENHIMKYISYNNLKYKNSFLDRLNQMNGIYLKKGINSHLICGTGNATGKSLQLDKVVFDEVGNITEYGKVKGKINSLDGDGTVLRNSAEAMSGKRYCVENANHSGLIMSSFDIITKILTGDVRGRHIKSRIRDKDYLGIVILGKGRINLKINQRTCILKSKIEMKDLYYFEKGNVKWIIIEINKKHKQILNYFSFPDEQIEVIISRQDRLEKFVMNTSKKGYLKIY